MIALSLVGRGSFDASEWDEALEAAAEEIASLDGNAAAVVMELPLGASYIEAGLAAFDLRCAGFGQIHSARQPVESRARRWMSLNGSARVDRPDSCRSLDRNSVVNGK